LVFSLENKAFSSFHDEAITSSRSEERSDLSHYFYEIKAIKTTGKSDERNKTACHHKIMKKGITA
jgi:hypothetical protein